MVWLSSDPSPSFPSLLRDLLSGYRAHNISVGAVDIDSGWSTGYNNFVPQPKAFPDWFGFIQGLKKDFDIRVILWMTSMINIDSPNFNEALGAKYFVRDGFGNQATNLSWWHGVGGLLDYSNPAARSWWEAQMEPILRGNGTASTGVDGFKCDGTDPYIIELLDPRGASGPLTFAAYSNYYYGHTLNFSRSLVPDALIWSRPVDSFPISKGLNISAFLEYSPKNVMFSGWVGDQDPTFYGLKDALINIFESAWQNYTNFGSDTGGYRTGNRTRELFLRWSQLNAFLPLFENGGNGDHTPWSFDYAPTSTVVTDTYRELVAAHYALGPYLYSTGCAAFEAGVSVLTPTAPPPLDFPFIIQPDMVPEWSFLLGANFFIYPVTEAGVASVRLTLPPARVSASGWADFWSPGKTYPPGATLDYPTPLASTPTAAAGGSSGPVHAPVFVATQALIPLHASAPLPIFPAFSGPHWAPALTLLYVFPVGGAAASGAPLHPQAAHLTNALLGGDAAQAPFNASLSVHNDKSGGSVATLNFTPLHRPLILLLQNVPPAFAGLGEAGGVASQTQRRAALSVQWQGVPLNEVPAKGLEHTPPHALALFFEGAGANSPGMKAAYRDCCAGTFVRSGTALAVMLSEEQAGEGGSVTIQML